MEQIKILNNMILSGVNNLYNHYPYIDKLNVFPVPDGDTGTNMNLTISNGYAEIENNQTDYTSIGKFLSDFARGLIMGARGNSGVIFSQIIKGFSLGMNNSEELSVEQW
ncbi:dihydroxyacetone kinase-like protein, partial [Mycoplasma putrefaciens]